MKIEDLIKYIEELRDDCSKHEEINLPGTEEYGYARGGLEILEQILDYVDIHG